MKKVTVIVLLIAGIMAFSGCNEQTCKSQEVYYSSTMVDTKAKIITAEQEILNSVDKELNKKNLFTALGAGQHTFNIDIAVSKDNKCKSIEIDYKGKGNVSKMQPFMENFNKVFSGFTYNAAKIAGKEVNSKVSISLLIIYDANGKVEKSWKLVTDANNSTGSNESKYSDYFTAAEKMPEIVGGFGELVKGIVYPEEAKEKGIEGKVMLQVYIDEKGNVVEIEVLKSVGHGCDEAAIKAVKGIKFTPAIQHGEKVKSMVVIPIMFKLQ